MTNWQALAEKYRAALWLIAERGGKIVIEDDYDKGTGIWCAGQAKDALMQEWAEKCSDGLESKMFEDVRKVCAEDHPDAPEHVEESCHKCYFYRHQRCQRHAPICRNEPEAFSSPVWPRVDWGDWCGEWQAVNNGVTGVTTNGRNVP